MSKLREQFLVNDRLREYIERMLSVIIENNPQLLEVATNPDMPIRRISTSDRKPSVPLINPPKESEESTDGASADSTKVSKVNDKYCRL